MCLPTAQVDHFYSIWRRLLYYVNEQRQLVPGLLGASMDAKLNIRDVLKIRDVLWQDDSLLDEFIQRNPAGLPADDLALAESWKHRHAGTFFVFKALTKHAIFIEESKQSQVYAVKGLYSSFDEVFPYFPILTQAVLLPYGDEITTDGLFQPYNVTFGGGIRGNLKSIYDDAKEMGTIITSLLPEASQLTPEAQAARAKSVNAKVLEAFEKHLYRDGQSPKIVERDAASAAGLAEQGLRAAAPRSLREIEVEDVRHYLAGLPEADRRTSATGLKRLAKFLRDSGRMDWDAAEDLLAALKR